MFIDDLNSPVIYASESLKNHQNIDKSHKNSIMEEEFEKSSIKFDKNWMNSSNFSDEFTNYKISDKKEELKYIDISDDDEESEDEESDFPCIREILDLLRDLSIKSFKEIKKKNENKIIEKNKNENKIKENNEKKKEKSQMEILYNECVLDFLLCKNKLSFYPKIPFELFKKVKEIFDSGRSDKEIVKHNNLPQKLSYSNLQTLKCANWLNDEIINAYCKLIEQKYSIIDTNILKPKIKIINSFFYPEIKNAFITKNYTKVSLENNSNFFPINLNDVHWVFCEVNKDNRQIIYYDSFHTSSAAKEIFLYFKEFCNQLNKQEKILENNFQWDFIIADFPKQNNGSDCGVFMLKGIHFRTFLEPLNFDQFDIQYFRILIAAELLNGQIF